MSDERNLVLEVTDHLSSLLSLGKKRNAYKILGGELETKRSLWRLTHRRAKSPRYPLCRILDDTQRWSGPGGKENKNPVPAGNRTPVVELLT
jgi:hypothetical protein